METQTDVRVLSDAETQQLVTYLWHQEADAIQQAKYKSPTDNEVDLRDSAAAHDEAIKLLANLQSQAAAAKDSAAAQVLEWMSDSARTHIRLSVMSIKNMRLRREYLGHIRTSSDFFAERVTTSPNPDQDLPDLARQASIERNRALEITRAKLNPMSLDFSKWMKDNPKTFESLVDHYANQFERPLTWRAQLDVYEDIVRSSGRGNWKVNFAAEGSGIFGYASVIFVLASMTWEIAESSHPTVPLVKDALEAGAGFVGADLGMRVGTAIAVGVQTLGELIGVAGGPGGVFVGGLLGGLIGGFFGGVAADTLYDPMMQAFALGLPTDPTDNSVWANPVVYKPTLPDGAKLCRELFPGA
jgi:hypothetical protein